MQSKLENFFKSQVKDETQVKDIDAALKIFNLEKFRPFQKELIDKVLLNLDLLVLMPTGGGKSLIFQLPAIIQPGITIVISPLIALIQNQVDHLKKLGIKAESLNSSTPATLKSTINQSLASSSCNIKLLYVTPELLATVNFRSSLKKLFANKRLNRLVVDEAHCISEWGHDFRGAYRELSYWKKTFKLPITALTATATESVKKDIISSLELKNTYIHSASFNRENLFYEVRFKPSSNDPFEDCLKYLESLYEKRASKFKKSKSSERARGICGIIYSSTRQSCEEISNKLKLKDIKAAAYHAGLSDKVRSQILSDWTQTTSESTCLNVIDIVCATISFGMGIDKHNVRFVIHWDMPKTMESYYQESGRAGRDMKPARAILYYSSQDLDRVKYLMSSGSVDSDRKETKIQRDKRERQIEGISKFVEYCENLTVCRHIFISKFFDPSSQITGLCDKMCDICRDPEKVLKDKSIALSSFKKEGTFLLSGEALNDPDSMDHEKFDGFRLADGSNISLQKKKGRFEAEFQDDERYGFRSAKAVADDADSRKKDLMKFFKR